MPPGGRLAQLAPGAPAQAVPRRVFGASRPMYPLSCRRRPRDLSFGNPDVVFGPEQDNPQKDDDDVWDNL